MTNSELTNINGGSLALNNTLLNTLIRFTQFSLELGRTLGSYIRRSLEKSKCR